ncbi:thioesterase family protein [Nitriliruptoraceae bacterium ZYF776]|nr:thioesterase family protein [Profundirhabdus halotolerans]
MAAGQPTQPVASSLPEARVQARLVDAVAHRVGDEDLPALRAVRHPGREGDVRAEEVAAFGEGLAGVHAHADPDHLVELVRDRALERDREPDTVVGPLEGEHQPVALRLDDAAAMVAGGAAGELVVRADDLEVVGVAEPHVERGRARHVGEDQRDGPVGREGWQQLRPQLLDEARHGPLRIGEHGRQQAVEVQGARAVVVLDPGRPRGPHRRPCAAPQRAGGEPPHEGDHQHARDDDRDDQLGIHVRQPRVSPAAAPTRPAASVAAPAAVAEVTVHRFERDTAVERVAEGRYRGVIDPGWAVIDGAAPNGGYLMALAARAMRDPIPHPDPVTVTAHYLAPPAVGEVNVDVEVVRSGRRHSTVAATLSQDGDAKVRLLGAFADLDAAEGPTQVDRRPPELPPREACVRFTDDQEGRAATGGFPAPPIALRFDHHIPAAALGWAEGRPSGRGEIGGHLAWRDGAPMDTLGLLVVADCYPPAVFDRGLGDIGWVPTIELTVQVRKRPSPGYLAGWFTTAAVTDGYLEEDGEVWDADGDLVVLSRQLALAARPSR